MSSFQNNQRDGYQRQTINVGKVSYHNNSLAGNTPAEASVAEGGYEHYQEKVEGRKIQARSESFADHFSQATLFWNSMSKPEKRHIIEAFRFELGKVKSQSVKQQVVDMFANVSLELATKVTVEIGAMPPKGGGSNVTKASPALSQENTKKSANTRTVAVIITDGFNDAEVTYVLDRLKAAGIQPEIISERLGKIRGTRGTELEVDHTFLTTDSVLFDAVYMVRGSTKNKKFNKDATYFIDEAFTHYKPIGATHEGRKWLEVNNFDGKPGVVMADDMEWFVKEFVKTISVHRHWERPVV